MAAPRSDFSFFSKSKSGKPSGSGTTVTTRVITKKVPAPAAGAQASQGSGAVKVVARDATPSSTISSSSKRKLEASAIPPKVKKQRISASPSVGLSSRASSAAPPTRAPELAKGTSAPSRRSSSRSRSPSVAVTPKNADEGAEPRRIWTEKDVKLGSAFLSVEAVVRENMKHYERYFRNPDDPEDTSFDPHPTHPPIAELEFPNTGACERYILLSPKDKDLWDPIKCFETTLYTIIEFYLTPEQRSLFGTLPDHACTRITADSTPEPEPAHAEGQSTESTVSTPESLSSLNSATTSSSVSSTSSVFSTISAVSSLSSITELQPYAEPCSFGAPVVDYLNLLQRAIRRRNGPLFFKVMDAINALLRAFKYPTPPPDLFDTPPPNALREAPRSWLLGEIPEKVVLRIIEETYYRAVSPHVNELNRYEAFSSTVYGELLPPFVKEIIKTTGITSKTLFMDLGSGVGNVLIQTSLATGCRSYGIELLPAPAKLARSQLEQFKLRCKMWGLQAGDIELEEGDMLESKRTDELIKQADVVLVNNKVFQEPLNEALRSKFLDLKDGAIVVSLKPFVSPTRTVNERNTDDISGIFKVTERPYYAGSVSWSSFQGSYYLHRVDREDLKKRIAELSGPSTRPSRSTRSRR